MQSVKSCNDIPASSIFHVEGIQGEITVIIPPIPKSEPISPPTPLSTKKKVQKIIIREENGHIISDDEISTPQTASGDFCKNLPTPDPFGKTISSSKTQPSKAQLPKSQQTPVVNVPKIDKKKEEISMSERIEKLAIKQASNAINSILETEELKLILDNEISHMLKIEDYIKDYIPLENKLREKINMTHTTIHNLYEKVKASYSAAYYDVFHITGLKCENMKYDHEIFSKFKQYDDLLFYSLWCIDNCKTQYSNYNDQSFYNMITKPFNIPCKLFM